MTAEIHDTRICELGEGAFWHPERQQFFWFDILNRKLLTQENGQAREFTFPEMVSALGWVDRDTAVMASESGLLRVDLNTGATAALAPIAAGQPATRSNDGRADRQGGFWWGTMGKRGGDDPGLGAIWRFYKGEVRQLVPNVTIPNAICFAPDGRTAYFADTVEQKVWTLALDAEGWPVGERQLFLDLAGDGLYPDGAVICAEGLFWNAQWGAGRVAAYAPDGRFVTAIAVSAPHASCPAFGGADLDVLHVTTAQEGMSPEALADHPHAGRVFTVARAGRGLAEPRVLL